MNILRKYLLPPLIAIVYWLWSHTWRFKINEDPLFTEARLKGPVIFAHWHGDEMVVLRLGPKYHCAAMTSTSSDGELMTKVLKLFGFGIARGSSTRGGARALIGMLKLMKEGFNATVAVDGPKGPRHKVKPGIWALAKHSEVCIIPTGVAKKSALVFEKSWNKTFLPWPFSKVIVSFGAPMKYDERLTESEQCLELERRLFIQRGHAQKPLLALAFLCLGFLAGCASSPETPTVSTGGAQTVLGTTLHTPLKPKGVTITGNEPATVKYILPGSIAQKYGFRVGDQILKVNGNEIASSTEFEKKIAHLPSSLEIEYKTRGKVNKKYITLNDRPPRFGATTEIQNQPLIKRSSAAIINMNKGLLSTYASVSENKDRHELFVNIIVDSDMLKSSSKATINAWTKSPKKLIGSSQETIDALGAKSVLISRKFNLSSVPPEGVVVALTLEKQQFTFEFQE